MLSHSFTESKTPIPVDTVAEFKKYLFGYKNGRATDAAERPNSDGSKGKEPLAQ